MAIVGNGRLGNALAAALRAAGVEVSGPLGRDATPGEADAVLLCVPDAEIGAAARPCRPDSPWATARARRGSTSLGRPRGVLACIR